MAARVEIRQNRYHDSVQLMYITNTLRDITGVEQVFVAMATQTNKEIFSELGLSGPETKQAGNNDLLIGIEAETEQICDNVLENIEELLTKHSIVCTSDQMPTSFEDALKVTLEANLCVVSVPGEYAKKEAAKALKNGLHVLLFSDKVSYEDELFLKKIARDKGLLCMGPDCGVANINGTALLVGSETNKGPIGIIGASGAGIQQVGALIDRAGSGISQAIGTGGRDLKDEIGALTMLSAIEALETDNYTKVIVLISRKPGKKCESKVLQRVAACKKPVVCCFIGCQAETIASVGAVAAINLEDAAVKALSLIDIPFNLSFDTEKISNIAQRACKKMLPEQKYIRGLFCSGTFCEESISVLQPLIGNIYSNIEVEQRFQLNNATASIGNAIIDYGEEEFTQGRPHPVLDPKIRCESILREAEDSETAVLLMDFILGPAVHPDPVGVTLAPILQAQDLVKQRGGSLAIIASICGTDNDPQNLTEQQRKLSEIGVLVLPSNVQAAKLAAKIIHIRQRG